MSDKGLAWRVTMLAALALTLAFGTVFFTWATVFVDCNSDTSSCAIAGQDQTWAGRVFTDTGEPAANALVKFEFGSMELSGHERKPIYVRTDAIGRYCLHWPKEQAAAYVEPVGVLQGGGSVDPRLAQVAQQTNGWLILPAPTGVEADAPSGSAGTVVRSTSLPVWTIDDQAAACSDQSPPWYRFDAVGTNWRLELINYLALTSIPLAIAGAFLRRRPVGQPLAAGALGMAATAAVFWILTLGTHTI